VNVHADGQGGGDAFSDSDNNLEPSHALDLLGGNHCGAGTAVISTTARQVSTLMFALEDSRAFDGETVGRCEG